MLEYVEDIELRICQTNRFVPFIRNVVIHERQNFNQLNVHLNSLILKLIHRDMLVTVHYRYLHKNGILCVEKLQSRLCPTGVF